MAEEENNEEVKPKGSGKTLIIVLIALVVILLLSVVGGGYFLYSQGVFNQGANGDVQQESKKDTSSDSETFKADINDLVLNITNAKGKEKLMKLSFSIKSSEPTIAAIVEEFKAEIIDVVIAQISARSSEELLTVGGKNLLKDELIEDINKVISEVTANNSDVKQNSVQKILFTSFVIK